jgi:hypothetical protein
MIQDRPAPGAVLQRALSLLDPPLEHTLQAQSRPGVRHEAFA